MQARIVYRGLGRSARHRALTLAAALAAGLLAAPAATAAVFTVDSTADVGDATPGDGTCLAVVGLSPPRARCTFRAAIEEANATPGRDTIRFGGIPTDARGFAVLTPAVAYPRLSEAVVIDGYTAPGYDVADPHATPVVQIDGGGTTHADGLVTESIHGTTLIRGLAVAGFDGFGIQLRGRYATVQGNHAGILYGDVGRGNGLDGIHVAGSASYNVVGVTCGVGPCVGKGNVASANDQDGIEVRGTSNYVGGNVVGLAPGGESACPNPTPGCMANASWGIRVVGKRNEIGVQQLVETGEVIDVVGNVVSTSGQGGIQVSGSSNSVLGNLAAGDGPITPDGSAPNDGTTS